MKRISLLLGLIFPVLVLQAQQFFIADVRNENNKITVDFRIDGNFDLERYEVKLYSSHDDYSQPMQFVTGDITGELPNTNQIYSLIWDAQKELIEFDGEVQLELRGEVTYLPIHSGQDKLSGKQQKETEIQWQGGNPADRVKIELVKNDVVVREITTSNNTGDYTWMISKDIEKGKGYKIRLTNLTNTDEVFESQSFAIGGGINPILIAGGSAGAAGLAGVIYLISNEVAVVKRIYQYLQSQGIRLTKD